MIAQSDNKKIFHLAWPMLLANSSGPLLGLVDTAVIGHLEHAYYLGGVAIGAMVITFMLWLMGFLRMSTTALTAQAQGAADLSKEIKVVVMGVIAALSLAGLFLVLQEPIKALGFWAAGGSEQIQQVGRGYYDIRILSLPAALVNLVLLGWLMGRQRAKLALVVTVVLNLINLSLDILFVWQWGWGVAGAAWAAVIAEYTALVISLWFASRLIGAEVWHLLRSGGRRLLSQLAFAEFFSLNRDILLRTLCLEICFAFVTFQGARLGDNIVAANAVLMNFLMLISLGLDAIAYAAEVLVGHAKGARKVKTMLRHFAITLKWSAFFSLLYTLLFLFAGKPIIHMMSSIDDVVSTSLVYLPWIIALPLLAHWCYFFDGVFIGLTRAKEMRNSMIVSVLLVFFPVWWLTQAWQNHALWGALSALMIARGVTLAWSFYRLYQRQALLD